MFKPVGREPASLHLPRNDVTNIVQDGSNFKGLPLLEPGEDLRRHQPRPCLVSPVRVAAILRACEVVEGQPARMIRAEVKRLRVALYGPGDLYEPDGEEELVEELPDGRRLAFHYERVYWRFYPRYPGYVRVMLLAAEAVG